MLDGEIVEKGEVDNIIFDMGDVGREPRVRGVGKNLKGVARNVFRCRKPMRG